MFCKLKTPICSISTELFRIGTNGTFRQMSYTNTCPPTRLLKIRAKRSYWVGKCPENRMDRAMRRLVIPVVVGSSPHQSPQVKTLKTLAAQASWAFPRSRFRRTKTSSNDLRLRQSDIRADLTNSPRIDNEGRRHAHSTDVAKGYGPKGFDRNKLWEGERSRRLEERKTKREDGELYQTE